MRMAARVKLTTSEYDPTKVPKSLPAQVLLSMSIIGVIGRTSAADCSHSGSLSVGNVAPVVTLSGATSVDEGTSASYHFTVVDAGMELF